MIDYSSSDKARREKERIKKARHRAKKRKEEEDAARKFAQALEGWRHDPNEGGLFERFVVPQLNRPAVTTMEAIVKTLNKIVTVTQVGEKIFINWPKRFRTPGFDQHQQRSVWFDKWNMFIKFVDADDDTRYRLVHWFQAKPSTLPRAGFGLCAATEFKEGSIIGFYAGAEIKRVPDPPVKFKHAIRSTRWGLIDAKTGCADPNCLERYMGTHMMNDPTMGLPKGTKEWKEAEKKINTVMSNDLFVSATCHINAGDELFVAHE